ncbi:C-terminal binding protein [Paenibacillus qinlingensis]|uniref:D-3-phosphoglycerate dehydrogenase n=1 Tax=Paenibacillus qinlingensis TaxID=1837343 RepID=A0ABU1P0G1_9BACL|nr:C-terminal binding protein [Paenibacillus qinlingensis]MDR6553195.1 D-3-phosphoglycerate dehydrogenase [Paenibacillus qinlingensis]
MMTAYTVVVTDYGFPDLKQEEEVLLPMGVKLLSGQCKTQEEVLQLARHADAIISERAPITKAVIDSLERCKIIVRYGVGVDNVDIEAAKARNIPVVNVPDYGTGEVADHAMSLLLASVRKIPQVVAQVRRGVWQITPCRPLMGLNGKTLGIAGFGNIGKDVAKRAQSFGINTIGYDPFVQQTVFEQQYTQKVDWHQLLEQSDMISVHLPLTADTKHIFNRDAFERMKSTAYLINTSRGAVIHTESLIEALTSNQIAGAALDVLEQQPVALDSPLLQIEQCLITSHCAWYSESSLNRLQRHAALEVQRILNGERPKHIVNGVEVYSA